MTATRSLLRAALALVLATPLAAHADDAPPSTPTGLVANAYGGTAGGIRWNRSSDDRGAVAGYEVTRDGTVLGVRDALSHVDHALAPATSYTYGVTAIDGAGQRSGTATIRLTTDGGTPPGAPAAPTGFRTSVYSSTAAELFWARAATPGLRHEVRRDGAPLAIIEGTSYFDDTLSGGTLYVYDVVAIDRAGRRSSSSRIALRTADAGSPSAGPSAPTGLRASVYSGTAAELFWARPTTPGLRHEVRRDGAPLAIIEGTSYAYGVVAIDREGRLSASADVTLTTFGDAAVPGGNPFAEPDPDGATTIARIGYPAVRELFDELVATSYLALYHDIDLSPIGLAGGQGAAAEDIALDCPGGGSVSGTRSYFSFDIVLDRCAVDGVTLSGALANAINVSVFGLGNALSDTVTFEALRIEAGAAGTLELTGTSRRSAENFFNTECGGAVRRTRALENRVDAARIERGMEVTVLGEASWRQRRVTGMERPDGAMPDEFGRYPPCTAFETLTLDGAAAVASTRFGAGVATLGKTADVVRGAPAEGTSSASGRLAAEFADGSTLAVTLISDADAGVQVDIVADGAAVSFADAYAFEAREDLPPLFAD